MTDFASINFPCPQCGALFALTEKVAARKIQCPCGKVFVAPALPEIVPDPEAYDIGGKYAEPADRPAARGKPKSIAETRGDLYPHRKISSFSTDDSEVEFSVVRDRVVPIVLLVVGLIVRVGEVPYDRTMQHANLVAIVGIILFQIVISVTLMLVGVFVSAKILSANFGAIGTAALKLCSIAVFAWSVGAIIPIAMNYEPRAFIMGLQVILIIYAIAFWSLFSLDLQEGALTVVICVFLQILAAFVVFSQIS